MRHALSLALQEFNGAMVIVSHDRHLLRSVTDKLLLVVNGGVREFSGDLDDYAAVILFLRRSPRKPRIAEPKSHAAAGTGTTEVTWISRS